MSSVVSKMIYFGYFLKSANYKELRQNINFVSKEKEVSKIKIVGDFLSSSIKYESSFEDYFDLRFFDMPKGERKNYATTGIMKQYHTQKNQKKEAEYFRNKFLFSEKFPSYTKRSFLQTDDVSEEEIAKWFVTHESFIAKPLSGQVGKGVEKLSVNDFESLNTLITYLKTNKLNLLEEVIDQHEDMSSLNPTSVNTVRVMTDLHNDKVRILGASLRIGMGGIVDNMAAGGIAAPVDPETGIVSGTAMSKSVKREIYSEHPITGAAITGIQLPYWEEVLKMVRAAALVVPEVKSVGWDVAITPNGPAIIEGNDNWDKVLWQMPQSKGLKYMLDSK
ncbi:sugar-transfer associated ATP-grasp domain-containing protein [Planococcus maritimus]|uniref:sugar-transfer associated ATP-grasp domain-containing protein n=1 Tax=Planococcus maritimus TaxID=192421 RepID=UPI000797019B|nr:sugar-transfer associated ATP-grasp domain-containing protein [Planococcus maritimus]KYG59406.1 hypothetical protein AY633_03945 [Planococcus maritimus]